MRKCVGCGVEEGKVHALGCGVLKQRITKDEAAEEMLKALYAARMQVAADLRAAKSPAERNAIFGVIETIDAAVIKAEAVWPNFKRE